MQVIKTGLLGQTSENWSHLLLFGLRKLKIFIFLRENLLLKFMYHFGNINAFVVGINLEYHLKIDVFRPKKIDAIIIVSAWSFFKEC